MAVPCWARVITVDDDGLADFNNIQAAIDFASGGDTIIVQPGRYQESINFLGKNITLTSTNPANPNIVAATIIDYNNVNLRGPAVVFRGIEDINCTLAGFNINGYIEGWDWLADPPSPNPTHATITHCLFQGNSGKCGTVISMCDGIISNCVVAENINQSYLPCVTRAIDECHGLIKNCTIVNNGYNIGIGLGGVTTIENCIVYNRGNNGSGIFLGGPEATVNILYSDIKGGVEGIDLFLLDDGVVNWGPGNIDADPVFGLDSAFVCWFKFDEGKGRKVYDSVGEHEGRLRGSPVWTEGFIDGALRFDGKEDYVRILESKDLRFNSNGNNFSIFVWMRASKADSGPGVLVDMRDENDDGWVLRYTKKERVMFSLDRIDITSSTAINDTSWHLVGAVIDRDGRGQIYIDGEPDGAAVAIKSEAMKISAARDMTIGRVSYKQAQYLKGKIEEVRIYSRVLSGGEIRYAWFDPFSERLVSPDYRLQSAAGRWDARSQRWVEDIMTSPCIDAGNPGCPLGDERSGANNIRINMGAYGGTATASKSPAGWRSIADLNNDWVVDFDDLALFVEYWLTGGDCVPGDFSRDGMTEFEDFGFLADDWLQVVTEGRIITVDDDGPADFDNVQTAIDNAIDGGIIIVRDGRYTGAGNRDIDFGGKAITVRSENGPSNCMIDCQGSFSDPHRGFIFDSGEGPDSILEGFTITNGYAAGSFAPDNRGGAIYCYSSSPTIRRCAFVDNRGGRAAGAIQNSASSPVISNCTFTGNSVLVIQLTFGGGGAICNSGGSPVLTNCIFTGNHAGWGGAVSNEGSSPKIMHCTFTGNYGGGNAICNWSDTCNPTVRNCILWNGGNEILNQLDATIDITYSDVEDGWPGLGNIDADPRFVEPGYWDANGTPNDANDDFWVDGNYHLKSEGWRWNAERQEWDFDRYTSQCIDAGSPGSSLGEELLSVPEDPNNEWGQNLRINMGVYGGTAEASMPPYDWRSIADLTNDWVVDLSDLAVFVDFWLQSGECIPSDLSRNGSVGFGDFSILADEWGW